MQGMMHINCDMAESYGNLVAGNDMAILPLVDSVNVACGFHGGDPLTIERVIIRALELGKQVGAHPSFPDLQGFGRRFMQLSDEELAANLRYQISAVKSMTESLGGALLYVKPHGALYNVAAHDKRHAAIIVRMIQSMDSGLKLMAPYGSAMAAEASEQGVGVIFESFGDRQYNEDGSLVSRNMPASLLTDVAGIVRQINQLREGRVKAVTGQYISIISESICIHGDNPVALEALQELRKQNLS
jgi:UPF0271 protein